MTTISKFRKNDEGSALELVCKEGGAAVNISSATVKKIYLQKPDGTVVEKTAVFSSDGSDGKIKYSLEAGVLDATGEWKAQGYVELSGGQKLRTSNVRFEVEPILE